MKYLHGVLTVIAICLILITFTVTGIIPTANAREINPYTINVPVDSDGSITVKLSKGETIDVNIDEIGGYNQNGKTIDMNIEEVGGYSTFGKLPVTVK